jgi:acetyltransferase-like isoleucine patch superfamily enzyme
VACVAAHGCPPTRDVAEAGPEASVVLVRLGDLVGRILALPVLVVYEAAARLIGSTAAFRSTSEAIAMIPGPIGVMVRRHVYRRTLAGCGSALSVGFGTVLTYPATVIGDDVYIGRFCAVALTTIGDGVMIGDQVRIISGRHGMEPARPSREQPLTVERVTIGRDAWLASGATVLAEVGPGAVVAAGAVVTRAVAADSIVGGVPARVLRRRDGDDAIG